MLCCSYFVITVLTEQITEPLAMQDTALCTQKNRAVQRILSLNFPWGVLICYLLLHVAYFVFLLFFKLDGTDIIKELYKRMDPTVTQPDSGDIKGDIQLSLKYNHRQQLLLVKVIRARDLVPRDLNGKSDPYAVLDLVPDV